MRMAIIFLIISIFCSFQGMSIAHASAFFIVHAQPFFQTNLLHKVKQSALAAQ